MSLKIGIVGLPNVGKSTLFHALTKKEVGISNYPFCTIEPNVGIVAVPDERLEKLAAISHSQKIIPAVVEFVDIAGLVKGAAEGEGLGNKFLSHIREVDTIAEVVRVFENDEILHVGGKTDPVSDIEILEYELILKDLETISRRLESLMREVRSGNKDAEEEKITLERIKTELESGRLLWKSDFHSRNGQWLQLLTVKPLIYIFNASEEQIQNGWTPNEEVLPAIGDSSYAIISAKVESELADLPENEKKEYLASMGKKESGLDQMIRIGYETLGLITFFTTGEKETRAWTTPQGSSAPRAGRAIHSDFEEKFIRAEVIHWQKLVEAGFWTRGRELGWIRTEGKDYIVQDGEVILFRTV